MKKSLISGLGMAMLLVSLMGCSADRGEVEARENDADIMQAASALFSLQPETSYKNDTAILTYNHDKSCIKRDSGFPISISFVDGTVIEIRNIWLTSAVFPHAGGRTVNLADNSISKTSQFSFDLPIDYDPQGCAAVIAAGVFQTENSMSSRAMIAERAFSPFVPMYTPTYSFARVGAPELNAFFTNEASQDTVGNLILQSIKDTGERPSMYRSRWTQEQVKEQSRIRVSYVPYENLDFGRICIKNKTQCAYFDLMREYNSPKNSKTILRFYVPLTNTLTVEFGQSITGNVESVNTVITPELASIIEASIDSIYNLKIREP